MNRLTPNLVAFSHSRARAAGLRRGFTLVEVMVAIAIALALIVGISEIFAMAQKTTGGGTALLKMNAQQRNMQSQFRQDFQGINISSSTTPGLVIASYAAAAFRNKQDMTESRDPGLPPDPRVFNNPGGDPPVAGPKDIGVPDRPYSVNGRIHRLDRLCMFVTNTFRRQTADAPNLTSQTSTQEGFVWYGHLALLNDTGISNFNAANPSGTSGLGAYMNPGTPSLAGGNPKNDNNEFASSWVLGRVAQALKPKDSVGGVNEAAYRPFLTTTQVPLSIIGNKQSLSTSGATASVTVPLYSSRYDLSYSSSADCRKAYLALQAAASASDIPWYEQISGLQCDLNSSAITFDQRYNANLYPTKPAGAAYTPDQFLSSAAALTAPVFVRGCTQFIVEFAGNFVTQNQDSSTGNNDYGQVLNAEPDPSGKLDFIPIRDVNDSNKWIRQIRWYGFPRDTMAVDLGAKDLNKRMPSPGQDGEVDFDATTRAITHDVVPLSVFLSAAGFPKKVPAFERNAVAFSGVKLPLQTSSVFPFNNTNYTDHTMPMVSTPYICAWDATTGANRLPKLIRITVAIDEPNGRLNSEQTFEYIFELPN